MTAVAPELPGCHKGCQATAKLIRGKWVIACPALCEANGDPLETGPVASIEYLPAPVAALSSAKEARATASRFPTAPARAEDMVSVEWIWAGMIPNGALTAIFGEEGIGKSTLLCEVISRLTRGALPGDRLGLPLRVLVVAEEDSRNSVWVPRLNAAGADLGQVEFLDAEFDLTSEEDRRRLSETIRNPPSGEPYAVVAFDALMDHLGKTNTDRSQETRRALRPANAMAKELNCALLGSDHMNKGEGTLRQRSGGSQQKQAVARSVIAVVKHPEEEDLKAIVRVKGNYGPPPPVLTFGIEEATVHGQGGKPIKTSRIVNLVESDLRKDELDRVNPRAAVTEGGSKQAEAARCILEVLEAKGSPMPAGEVLKALAERGIGRSTAYLGHERLTSEGRVQSGEGYWWIKESDAQ